MKINGIDGERTYIVMCIHIYNYIYIDYIVCTHHFKCKFIEEYTHMLHTVYQSVFTYITFSTVSVYGTQSTNIYLHMYSWEYLHGNDLS